jgi:hypothetical protein
MLQDNLAEEDCVSLNFVMAASRFGYQWMVSWSVSAQLSVASVSPEGQ